MSGIPIYNIADIEYKRKSLNAEIAIIAVPVDQAQNVADLMVANGIKALWNFTPSRKRFLYHILVILLRTFWNSAANIVFPLAPAKTSTPFTFIPH